MPLPFRTLLALLFFALFWTVPGKGADPAIRYLGIKQGLSNNSVNAIFQDHNGFMWFGTYDGLNRYDGYSFKVFRTQLKDTPSLPHNYITAIGEDRHHDIWVGTGQGVSIYHPQTNRFTEGMYVPFGKKQRERIPFNTNTILADARGNLLLGTNQGGLLVQPAGSEEVGQLPYPKDAEGKYWKDVRSILIDRQQRVWLFIDGLGLCIYRPGTSMPVQLVSNQVKYANCMTIDEQDNIWIGGVYGIVKYATRSGSFQPVPASVNPGIVISLQVDRQRKLWIGTAGNGIILLDPATGAQSCVPAGESKNMLSNGAISVVYEDREARKWIGTLKGGINIMDGQKNSFQVIEHDPLNANSLVHDAIISFYEAGHQQIWIGTDGGGISVWDRQQNRFTNYRHRSDDKRSLSSNMVSCFQKDYLGNFWIATFSGGINKFDPATGSFDRYSCTNPLTGEVQDFVWLVYEDRQQNLWAATYGMGRLYRLNRQTNRFEMFCQEPVDIYALLEDRHGTLWAGTPYGLASVDQKARKYTYYGIPKPVRAIAEDHTGRLWLGTEGLGLNLFDQASGRVIARYTDVEGLCNNSVLNILEDDKGQLWVSTFHGLSRFDPAKKTFKNYYENDGLQSNQFSYNAARRLRSGEMLFGGISGFNIFNPDSLQVYSSMPPVFITSLRVNNQEVGAGSEYVKGADSNGIRKLVLPYQDAVLSFDFTALEYSRPEQIAYAYYLEGWDKNWNNAGMVRTANYTRLKEGHYRLRIRNTNAAGVWNAKELLIEIVVLPPWYRTWWAYLLYAGLVILLIYLYLRYQHTKTRLKYEVGLAQVQAEKERELAQLEIQKEKELNERKLTLFTDISHEFRTPLTLIINPLEDYIASKDPQQDKKELNVVYRNARRLLSLVDQLLQFRKAASGAEQLRIVQLNFAELCRDVYASFENSAKLKQLRYRFSCSSEQIELYADREKMEVILYNLLSNAIKFTPEGGEVALQVQDRGEAVEVRLKDSGVGIPPEIGNKLFERFYRVQETASAARPGFGIGLYLVKQFIDLLKGTISYESVLGAGTVFALLFQKGSSHLAGLPVYEEKVAEHKPVEELIAEPDPAEADKSSLEELVSDQKAILIVEDNEQIREYLGSIFKENFTVYQAVSGNDGIGKARKYLPDIIISDIMMDNGSGIELCNTIKNDPSLGHIPVILLTAMSGNDTRLQGTECGADDYLTKPFEKSLLMARVEALLKNRTKLQNYFYNEVTLKKQEVKISAEYKEFLDACISIVERHLEDDNFNIKKLSQEIGMSHSTLYRKVKSVSGQTIAAFIRFIRLRRAAQLLIDTEMNVNETATQVGIYNVKYFREQFHKLFGMNPSEYIKKYRRPLGKHFRLNKDSFGEEQ